MLVSKKADIINMQYTISVPLECLLSILIAVFKEVSNLQYGYLVVNALSTIMDGSELASSYTGIF